MATEAASGSGTAAQGGNASAAAATTAAGSQGASGGAAAAQSQGGAAASGGQAAGAAAAGAQSTQQAANTNGQAAQTQDGAKAGDQGKTAAAAAEVKYDLKAPEGVPAEAATKILADIAALAKAKGWSPEVAQELADRDFGTLAAIDTANKQLLADHRKQWVEAVKADKDLGGDRFPETEKAAKAAIARFDTTGELRKVLDASGYGDHPAFVRFAAAVGRAMAEDRVEHAHLGGSQRDLGKILYPSMKG